MDSWVISPLQPNSNNTFLGEVYKSDFSRRKIWIAFESVKRQKKNQDQVMATYLAIDPKPSKWLTRIGSQTTCDIKFNPKSPSLLNLESLAMHSEDLFTLAPPPSP